VDKNEIQAVPIWTRIPTPEFDYLTLMDVLQDYSKPRDKITSLMNQGVIQRIKKGHYVLGEGYRRQPVSREILGNQLYGPSYLSLESALQFHGMIPESVQAVTSVCLGPSRQFQTPLGLFTYRRVPAGGYYFGIRRVELDSQRAYLIAAPEKALADKLKLYRGGPVKNQRELAAYLVDDLRIDGDSLSELDHELMMKIATAYRSRKVQRCAALLKSIQG